MAEKNMNFSTAHLAAMNNFHVDYPCVYCYNDGSIVIYLSKK